MAFHFLHGKQNINFKESNPGKDLAFIYLNRTQTIEFGMDVGPTILKESAPFRWMVLSLGICVGLLCSKFAMHLSLALL